MRVSRLLLLCALLMALVFPVAAQAQSGPPYVGYFTPSTAPAGTTVRLYGSNLRYASVYFNGYYAPITANELNWGWIEVKVPSGASTGPLTVGNSYGTTTAGTFVVVQPLKVNSVSPYKAVRGATATIYGQGFDIVYDVKLGNLSLPSGSWTRLSSTAIRFTVPNDPAYTSGYLNVQTYYGGWSNSSVYFGIIVPADTKTGTTSGTGGSCTMVSPTYAAPWNMRVSVSSATDIDLYAFENYQTFVALQVGPGQPTNVYYTPPSSGSFMFCVKGIAGYSFTLSYTS